MKMFSLLMVVVLTAVACSVVPVDSFASSSCGGRERAKASASCSGRTPVRTVLSGAARTTRSVLKRSAGCSGE